MTRWRLVVRPTYDRVTAFFGGVTGSMIALLGVVLVSSAAAGSAIAELVAEHWFVVLTQAAAFGATYGLFKYRLEKVEQKAEALEKDKADRSEVQRAVDMAVAESGHVRELLESRLSGLESKLELIHQDLRGSR